MAVLVYQSGVAAQVTVGGAIADPAAASERCVRLSTHTAPEYPGRCHKKIVLRIGTAQTLTGEGRLTTERLRQLAEICKFQRTTINLQLSKSRNSLPPIPRPKPVSDERIAPR